MPLAIHFEELSTPKRAGGIEGATRELVAHLRTIGVDVTRSSEQSAARKPDCVHFHGLWSPSLARQFSFWLKQQVPCMVSPHGMLEPWALAHKRWKKLIAWHVYQRRLINQAVTLHATSERERSNFKTLGLKPPTATIPWGVSLPPARITKHETRNTELSPRTALFVGRIYPVKGLPLLIEAWARVRPDNWKLRIVGPDEAGHRAHVEASVRQQGLSAVVEFTKELTGPAKEAAYAEAELFVMPSHTENFGMAIAEALAHGVPVITTKGAPWQELIAHRCGWWVDIGVEPLACALREATQLTDEQRQEMGLRGRKLIETNYTWPAAAQQMLAVYRWVLGQGNIPDCVHTS